MDNVYRFLVSRLGNEKKLINSSADIVEQIMTQHWDITSCPCWVCRHGRFLGLKPSKKHIDRKRLGGVDVEIRVEDWQMKDEDTV